MTEGVRDRRRGEDMWDTERGRVRDGQGQNEGWLCICVSNSFVVHLKSVWLQGDRRHTFRDGKRWEGIQMDGFMAFATLACRVGPGFFFPPDATERREGGQGRRLASGEKTGSHIQKNKIKSTLCHWLNKWCLSTLCGHIFICTAFTTTRTLIHWLYCVLHPLLSQCKWTFHWLWKHQMFGLDVHENVGVTQKFKKTLLNVIVMYRLVQTQRDRCQRVVTRCTC